MQQNEPFPLEAVPPRVRRAILSEFHGRWPTVQEVAQISDRRWLATPDIGPSALETIHSILHPQQCQTDTSSRPQLTDAELLDRLEFIQEELLWLEGQLKARLPKTARRKPNRQWHKLATQDETGRR
jgi:hypothetical protein